MKISKIFTEKGENYFRKFEEELTLELLKKKSVIIALGGGAGLARYHGSILEINGGSGGGGVMNDGSIPGDTLQHLENQNLQFRFLNNRVVLKLKSFNIHYPKSCINMLM